MPEGPEVACVRDALSQVLTNKHVVLFEHTPHRFYKGIDQLESDIHNEDITIKEVSCYGKKLMIEFSNDKILFNSLGRFGNWSIDKKPSTTRLTFGIGTKKQYDNFDQVTIVQYVYYGDTKGEGRFEYTKSKNKKVTLSKIGPDVLQDHLSLDDFYDLFQFKPKNQIIDALLDQSIISGIGNYLRTDICYHAKLHPYRTVDSLSDDEWAVLHNSVYHICEKAYKKSGCTLGTFVTPNREKGTYVRLIDPKKSKTKNGESYVEGYCKSKRKIYWVPKLQK